MSVYYEVVVETTCCGRHRPLSNAVLTVCQLGLVIWGTYRCKDCEVCEQLERDEATTFCAPYWQVLSS